MRGSCCSVGADRRRCSCCSCAVFAGWLLVVLGAVLVAAAGLFLLRGFRVSVRAACGSLLLLYSTTVRSLMYCTVQYSVYLPSPAVEEVEILVLGACKMKRIFIGFQQNSFPRPLKQKPASYRYSSDDCQTTWCEFRFPIRTKNGRSKDAG